MIVYFLDMTDVTDPMTSNVIYHIATEIKYLKSRYNFLHNKFKYLYHMSVCVAVSGHWIP